MERELAEGQFDSSPEEDNIGDVMVVGGGISGIQAALDLADTGFKVYREHGMTSLSLPPMKLQAFYAQGSRTPNRMVPSDIGVVPVKVYFEPVNGYHVHVLEDFLFEHPSLEREVMPHG